MLIPSSPEYVCCGQSTLAMGHLPGARDPFVIVFGVNCQNADPWANVYQQHGKGIVKATWPLDTVFRIRGVLEKVALWVAVETDRVDVEQALDQTVQFIKLLQLQIRHLKIKTHREVALA